MHRIGRTARLGAEGDAISFACERYAMSLPDIEAYIEQKIPSEPVTQELMTALPRKPREGVELNAEEGESIGEIFKEVREARAAEDAKRGGGRGGPRSGGGGGRSGDRSSSAPRSGSGDRPARGPRPPRKPRVEGEAVANASVDAAIVQSAAAQAPRPPQPTTGLEDDARKPRKRRRRRHGRPLEGEAGSTPNATPAPGDKAATTPAASGDKPSLLSRIGRRIKSLVGG